MTYAGLKGLLVCGCQGRPALPQSDWVAATYTVDINPGMQDGSGPKACTTT